MNLSKNIKIILKTFAKFIFIEICLSLCVFTFGLHCKVTKTIPPSEYSLTEIMQELLLFVDIIFFGIIAHKNKSLRESSILAGCFTTCMFVRELDFFFDGIARNLWKVIVLTVIFIAFFSTFMKKGFNQTISSLVNMVKTNGFNEIFYGLLIILILSRFMGMNEIWTFANTEKSEFYIYQRFVEETLELCGYCIYTIGAAFICINSLKNKNKLKQSSNRFLISPAFQLF